MTANQRADLAKTVFELTSYIGWSRPNRLKQGLHGFRKAKSPTCESRAFCLNLLGWLMGLEPTTTGITILPDRNSRSTHSNFESASNPAYTVDSDRITY